MKKFLCLFLVCLLLTALAVAASAAGTAGEPLSARAPAPSLTPLVSFSSSPGTPDQTGYLNLAGSLLITIIIYSLPIFIYRYSIKKAPVDRKKARKITIIYAIVSFFIMVAIVTILYALIGYDGFTGGGILLWSFVNYKILTSGLPKESNDTAPAAEAVRKAPWFGSIRTAEPAGIINANKKTAAKVPVEGGQGEETAEMSGSGPEKQSQEAPPEFQTKFCYQCGNRLHPGSAFCDKCGAKVPDPGSVPR